jgi:hypothetical protein
MKRVSLSKLRERAQAAIDTITVGQLDPGQHCEFYFIPSEGDEPLEITQADFFDAEAPPGLYRFRVTGSKGEPIAEGDGAHIEFKAGDRQEERPNSQASVARLVSSLCNSSSSEVDRAHRRLREEEDRCDELKKTLLTLERTLRERERDIAELQAELEAAKEEDLGEFAEILGQIAIRVLGIDQQDPARAEDFEIVLNAVAKSPRAQAEIQRICGEAPLRRLGIGGTP